MPIKPIDILSMAPRSQEASQQHVNQNQRAVHAQGSAQNQFASEIKHNREQVTNTSQSENKEYRYDAKEKGNGNFTGNKNKKNKKKEDNKKKEVEHKRTNFDMKI